MAVDLFSEASPRYSFSHDINQASLAPTRSDPTQLDTGFDFEFGISDSFAQESSSADELFSQGILLPIQIREKSAPTSKQPINPPPPADQQEPLITEDIKAAAEEEAKEDAKEAAPSTNLLEPEEKSQTKSSFWSFKRSITLNCDAEYKKGLLCSLQGLSRSNSTGSVPNPKKSMQNKDKAGAINSSKHPSLPKSSSTSSSSSSSSSSYYHQFHHQKAQHSKGYYGGGSYGPGGPRTNSVLNVPPPYISNTNLFGLGSLFRNGKDKKPKK
uniref:Uncharacterized protein n=1 Tax=Kalanchoe fedtschenkoi TaxID=63787 RepID=A0A7N0TN54_KALFE